jgi:hypothetical protein
MEVILDVCSGLVWEHRKAYVFMCLSQEYTTKSYVKDVNEAFGYVHI